MGLKSSASARYREHGPRLNPDAIARTFASLNPNWLRHSSHSQPASWKSSFYSALVTLVFTVFLFITAQLAISQLRQHSWVVWQQSERVCVCVWMKMNYLQSRQRLSSFLSLLFHCSLSRNLFRWRTRMHAHVSTLPPHLLSHVIIVVIAACIIHEGKASSSLTSQSARRLAPLWEMYNWISQRRICKSEKNQIKRKVQSRCEEI